MDKPLPDTPAPPQFTLRGMFVLMAVAALLLGFLLPAINSARESSRRAHCYNNLMQVAVGLHGYHRNYKSLPPAHSTGPEEQPWLSWRVALSPMMSGSSFYAQYRHDEPWNGRNNSRLRYQYSSSYQCPTEPIPGPSTSYVAVVGPGTPWPAPNVSHFEDFSRGLSHTILVSEMSGSGIHWMEPRDLQFDEMEFKIYAPSSYRASNGRGSRQALSSGHPGGIPVVFADHHVEFLPVETSSEVLREMLLIGGSSDGQLRREE
jgi:uncharacterized protein DUF1559